jgi:hypothetical protein
MTHDEWQIPRFSKAAVSVLDKLHEHGWSMRIVPLFRGSALDLQTFAAALNELHERRWVRIALRRRPRASQPAGVPERCARIDRIVATRHGRWRYLATWPNPW